MRHDATSESRGGTAPGDARAGPAAAALLAALLAAPLSPSAAAAQDGGAPAAADSATEARPAPLVTDRPDFTESTASVAPGRVQLESGYTLARSDGTDEHAVGEVLLRVGVAGPLEARLSPGSWAVVDGPAGTADGLVNPAVGAKATLLEPGPGAAAAVPSAALLGSVTLPAGHDAVSADGAEPEAALALGWTLADGISAGANVKHARLLHDGERFGRTVASAALGVRVAEPLGAYAEYYTLRPSAPGAGAADVANAGLTLLLGADAQLDARAGAGLGDEGPDLVLGVGFAWRR